MSIHISNSFHFFVILVLFASSVGKMRLQVDGVDPCSEPLGACGPAGECDQRCKASHSDGSGSCDFGLCTCIYGCPPSGPSPPEPESCSSGLGLCGDSCTEDCCKLKCSRQYNNGSGYCDLFDSVRYCTCQYSC